MRYGNGTEAERLTAFQRDAKNAWWQVMSTYEYPYGRPVLHLSLLSYSGSTIQWDITNIFGEPGKSILVEFSTPSVLEGLEVFRAYISELIRYTPRRANLTSNAKHITPDTNVHTFCWDRPKKRKTR